MKPTFIIIGEQKAGTGWLLDRLREHPRVYCHPQEVNFFNDRRNHARGLAWYSKLLEGERAAVAVGEKSPDYFWLDRPGPEFHANPLLQIARELPDVQIVLSLRDPVDRAISAFNHHLQHRGRRIHPRLARTASLEQILFDERNGIAERWGLIRRGYYSARLKLAQDLFGGRLLTMIFEEDIVANPAQGLRRLCEHLGVRFEDGAFRPKDNRKERKPSYAELMIGHYVPMLRPLLRRIPLGAPFKVAIGATCRERLVRLYEDDVRQTALLLGRDALPWLRANVAPEQGR